MRVSPSIVEHDTSIIEYRGACVILVSLSRNRRAMILVLSSQLQLVLWSVILVSSSNDTSIVKSTTTNIVE